LRLWGRTWEDFYAAAARGLLALYGIRRIPKAVVRRRKVILKAQSPEELLVAWLGELNFYITAKGRIPAGQIFERAGPDEIRASLELLPAGALGRPLKGEVKSASYQKLSVKRLRGRWTATVILDV
jgi:SHS2 domain-containing protein